MLKNVHFYYAKINVYVLGNRTHQLYSHNLLGLHERTQKNPRIHLPEKMFPR